jgi:hypothetical protein
MEVKIRKGCDIAKNTAKLAIEDFKRIPSGKNFDTMISMIVRSVGCTRPAAIAAVHAKIPASRNFGGM